MALGEAAYNIECKKAILSPVELNSNDSHDGLAVVQLNTDLASTGKRVYFLSPHDRIISDSSTKLPYSEQTSLKFKTLNGQWIAQTVNGVNPTATPLKEIQWLDTELRVDTDYHVSSFDVSSGIYTYNQITSFEDLISFHSRTAARTAEVVGPISIHRINQNSLITPDDLLPGFGWERFKEKLTNGLEIFGNISEAIIGLYGIIILIKSIIIYSTGCLTAKKLAKYNYEFIIYLFSPMKFILSKLRNQSSHGEHDTEGTLSELEKIKISNQLPPVYPKLA